MYLATTLKLLLDCRSFGRLIPWKRRHGKRASSQSGAHCGRQVRRRRNGKNDLGPEHRRRRRRHRDDDCGRRTAVSLHHQAQRGADGGDGRSVDAVRVCFLWIRALTLGFNRFRGFMGCSRSRSLGSLVKCRRSTPSSSDSIVSFNSSFARRRYFASSAG